jgi:hypothetical protein
MDTSNKYGSSERIFKAWALQRVDPEAWSWRTRIRQVFGGTQIGGIGKCGIVSDDSEDSEISGAGVAAAR